MLNKYLIFSYPIKTIGIILGRPAKFYDSNMFGKIKKVTYTGTAKNNTSARLGGVHVCRKNYVPQTRGFVHTIITITT